MIEKLKLKRKVNSLENKLEAEKSKRLDSEIELKEIYKSQLATDIEKLKKDISSLRLKIKEIENGK